MKHLNSTFLTKLGWRALTDKDALWSRVLIDKCGQGLLGGGALGAETNASNAWKGITENVGIIAKVW